MEINVYLCKKKDREGCAENVGEVLFTVYTILELYVTITKDKKFRHISNAYFSCRVPLNFTYLKRYYDEENE